MAQKGDKFNPPATFGPVVQFDRPETQRTIGFSEDTYQGRILRNWGDALGSNPTVSILTGLRISGFGTPGSAPAAGTTSASMFGYIKQVQIDLARVRVDTTALRTGVDTIATTTATIAISTAAITVSTATLATLTATIAGLNQTIVNQQIQIINLLTSIDAKTL